jgi:hypothetical protein
MERDYANTSLVIHLETQKTARSKTAYDFIWSISGREYNTQESVFEYEADNRLYAAIVNCGRACRKIEEERAYSAIIQIAKDTSGEITGYKYDDMYAHHTLYDLLYPSDDFRKRKAISLFHEYSHLIAKIQVITFQMNILIELV